MSQVRGGRAGVELLKAEGVRCGKPAVIEIPIDPEEFPMPAASVRKR
jgi:hypothetical protein